MKNFNTRLIQTAALPRSRAMTGRGAGSHAASSGSMGVNPIHDHDGQLLRPAVLCLPLSFPGEEMGVRDGEHALFIDPGMAVEGEDAVRRLGGAAAVSGRRGRMPPGRTCPWGFHRVTSTFPTSFIKGHIYFFHRHRTACLSHGHIVCKPELLQLPGQERIIQHGQQDTDYNTCGRTPQPCYNKPVLIR